MPNALLRYFEVVPKQNFGEPKVTFGTATRILGSIRKVSLSGFGFGRGLERDGEPDRVTLTPDVIDKLFDLIGVCVEEAGVVLDRLDEEWDGSEEAHTLLIGLLMAAKELNDRFRQRRRTRPVAEVVDVDRPPSLPQLAGAAGVSPHYRCRARSPRTTLRSRTRAASFLEFYGAIVGTVALAISALTAWIGWRVYRTDAPRIHIELSMSTLGGLGELSGVFHLQVTNVGKRPTTLTEAGIPTPTRARLGPTPLRTL